MPIEINNIPVKRLNKKKRFAILGLYVEKNPHNSEIDSNRRVMLNFWREIVKIPSKIR